MRLNRMNRCSVLALAVLLSSAAAMGAQEYTGTVVPEATSTYAHITFTDIYGNYAYIARPGEIITPAVYGKEGKVVTQGNLLTMWDMRYWKAVLNQYLYNYKAAKDISDINMINMERYGKLYESNAESLINSYKAKYTYNSSIIALLSAEAAYKQYTIQVDKYKNFAPFEGIVLETYTGIGQATGGYKVIKVAQLNPICVSVKMDRESAKAIGNNTPVKIYPLNSDKPQGIIYGRSMLTDDGIQFFTENYPVIEGTKVIEDDSTPIILKNAVRKSS